MAPDKKEKPLLVFLSHTMKDRERAREIERLLSQQPRVRVMSAEMFSAGGDWAADLRQSLMACDLFMTLVSPAALESSWMMLELGTAYGLGKPIIGVFTRPDLMERLPVDVGAIRAVDFKDLRRPKTLTDILEDSKKQTAA
jgi:hypothetical protein